MSEQTSNLVIRNEGDVSWVTINRPIDRNALDSATIRQLLVHLEDTESSGVRVVAYWGAGKKHFIGGADGVEMYRMGSQEARTFSQRIQGLFNRMEQSKLLLIAAIDGLCFGGGLEFALACDLRFASTTSRMGLPEVKLGILPGGGGTQRLPRIVGFGKAVEMILTGKLIGAKQAFEMGLVHRVVSPEGLKEQVEDAAVRASRIPEHAFAGAKAAVYAARDLPLADGLTWESEKFGDCFSDPFFSQRVQEQLASGSLQTTFKLGEKER